MSITPRRLERLREILGWRLGSVSVIVEALHRRHNTSAILRSAEAFGLNDVHLVTGPFRTSKGAARGAERWMTLHRHATATDAIAAVRAQGMSVWVADLNDQALAPEELPVDGPVAVLFGSELTGVSDEARALADGVVTVPMRGLTESLNVSVAAAIVLRAVAERRRAALGGGDLPEDVQRAIYEAWVAREEGDAAALAAWSAAPPIP